MNISPFFRNLRSAYQAELEDLRSDSEGRDVMRQRLTQRRKELKFLLPMMEHLLTLAPEDFPDWDSLADAIHPAPWAQDLIQVIRKETLGDWFLTVAAGLEYMHSKPATAPAHIHEPEEDADEDLEADMNPLDAEEESDARSREEAGADWMVEQGFDRKD